MRVLQLINSLATGGAEKLLLESLPYYNEKGIKMDILVLNDQDYPFMEKLKAQNCCDIFILGKGSVYNPVNIFRIIPYLKTYDIIHVHLFPAQYWAVIAKLISFSRAKLIFTEHNTYNRRMSNALFRFCDRIIYSRYEKIVCITAEVKSILKKHIGSKKDKLSVIENGVNIASIVNAAPYQKGTIDFIDENDVVVIQVAAFREQKDQPTLIKAMHLLPGNYKLLLVGDGTFRADCESLAKELNLEQRVHFFGLRMDVANLLKTADIVVLSSKYEGLSLSSIEGMAAGKPFIASDVPGLSEIVKDSGMLFKQGDAEELASNIKNLMQDQILYKKVAEACQAKAYEYDLSKMVAAYMHLYNKLC